MTDDEAVKIIDKKVAELMEHFSAVRIFVNKHDTQTQSTIAMSRGGGCHYSQTGQIMEWIASINTQSVRLEKVEHSGDEDDEEYEN